MAALKVLSALVVPLLVCSSKMSGGHWLDSVLVPKDGGMNGAPATGLRVPEKTSSPTGTDLEEPEKASAPTRADMEEPEKPSGPKPGEPLPVKQPTMDVDGEPTLPDVEEPEKPSGPKLDEPLPVKQPKGDVDDEPTLPDAEEPEKPSAPTVTDTEEPEKTSAPTMTELMAGSPQVICGGQGIWKMLTPGSSVRSVQSIDWKAIEDTAAEYITSEDSKAKSLQMEIEELQRRIGEKQKMEARADASEEALRGLITKSLASEGAFGDLKTAQRTYCGVPFIRPRASRTAYRQSIAGFQSAAEVFFNGNVRLAGNTFNAVCTALLPCSGQDETCWCEELCQSFQDEAQRLSDATAGSKAGFSSDELLETQSVKKNELAHHMTEVAQCKQNRAYLVAFSKSFGELSADIKDKFQGVQDAEYALYDATYDLADLEDNLEQQRKSTKDALDVATKAGVAFEDARAALEKVEKEESGLEGKKAAVYNALASAHASLQEAKGAKGAASTLKMMVSAAMMKMLLHFEEEVQEPVRFTGLSEETDLDALFPGGNSPALLGAAGKVSEAVGTMGTLCAADAKQAFTEVSGTVDLKPLCQFGSPAEIEKEIFGAVSERTAKVRSRIEEVKSWLSPFKGQPNLTPAKLEEYLAAGEPKGLRETKGIFYQTAFYKYLQEWQAGGKFLGLMAELSKAVEAMDASVAELSEKLKGLQDEIAEVLKKHKVATDKLAEATKSKAAADSDKEMMDSKVKEMQAQAKGMQDNLDALTAKLNEAKGKLETAKQKLLTTHEHDVVELKSNQAHEAILVELHTKRTMASRNAALLELALFKALGRQAVVANQLSTARSKHAARGQMRAIDAHAQS